MVLGSKRELAPKMILGPKRELDPKREPGPKMELGPQKGARPQNVSRPQKGTRLKMPLDPKRELGPKMSPCPQTAPGAACGARLGLQPVVSGSPPPSLPLRRLFQLEDEAEALQRFEHYAGHLRPFYESCPEPLTPELLQQLCDCLRGHPAWSPAHVAAELGLLQAFRHNGVLG